MWMDPSAAIDLINGVEGTSTAVEAPDSALKNMFFFK